MEKLKKLGEFLLSRPVWLSFVEAIFVLVVSNFSLLFLVFAYLVETKGAKFSFKLAYTVISNNINPTEVLVYLLALIAPALWLMFSNWRGRKHVVFFTILIVLQFIIVTGSAYIYGTAKFGSINNQSFVNKWALYCFITGVAIWYITLIYSKWLPALPILKQPESGKAILEELEGDQ